MLNLKYCTQNSNCFRIAALCKNYCELGCSHCGHADLWLWRSNFVVIIVIIEWEVLLLAFDIIYWFSHCFHMNTIDPMEQKGEILYSPAKLAVYKARKQLLYIMKGTPPTKLPSPKKPFTSFATQLHSQTGVFEFSQCTSRDYG